MLVRLLLVLLLAAFAVPSAAPAACHDAPTATHTMPMGDTAPEQRAAPVHACVGCIPPSDWLNSRLASPSALPTAVPSARRATVLAGIGSAPAIPPPRAR